MSKKDVVLHDPSIKPELNTSTSPLALKRGMWQNLNNIRLTEQVIRARYGSSTLGAIVTSGTFRGAFVGAFYGTETIFVAAYIPDSLKVRVYMSTDAVTWTEITKQFTGTAFDTTIGPYGLTRMDDDGLVWFDIVQDRDVKVLTYPSASQQQDVLVFANQSSYPRTYSRFYGGGADRNTYPTIDASYTAIVEPIDPPTSVRSTGVVARFFEAGNGFAIRDSGSMDIHNSGANFVFSESGGSTNNHMLLTVGTSSAANDTAIIEDTSNARVLLLGKQLHIGYETTWVNFLSKVKIEVGTYSGGSFSAAAIVYNPADQKTEAIVSVLSGNVKMLSIDVEEFNTNSTYDALRFTFLGSAEGSSQAVKIWMVAPGVLIANANPGTTQWAISYFNGGSHTESPGVVLGNVTYPNRLTPPGGNEIPDDYTGYAPPASADLFYSYYLPIPNPSQAQIDKGVEAARIYRQRPGDGDLFLVESYELAIYSEPGTPAVPTWTFVSGSASSILRVTGLGREPLSQTTYPDAFHVAMPKARAGIGTSDRMFIGARVTGVPNLMVSAQDQPFRFRTINNYDSTGNLVPDSAFALNLQGDQVNGFAQVSGSTVGLVPSTAIAASAVYIFGEKFTYMTGGKTSEQIAQVSNTGHPGTFSPGTIVVDRETVTYLDRYMQVRKLRGGSSIELSRNKVDNILKGIPVAYRRYLWAEYFEDRYYLCYVPEGATTKTRILVWSDEFQGWESIDIPPKVTEALIRWHDGANEVKLIALMQNVGGSTTLTSYRYESGASDVGGTNNIAIAGSSFEMHSQDWATFNVHRIGVVADQANGKTFTTTVTYKPWDSSRTGSLSLDKDGFNYIRRFDHTYTPTGEQFGASAVVGFSASVPGGFKILEMKCETEDMGAPFEVP